MRQINFGLAIALVVLVSWSTGVWAQAAPVPPPPAVPDSGFMAMFGDILQTLRLRFLLGAGLLLLVNAFLIGFFVEFFRKRGAR